MSSLRVLVLILVSAILGMAGCSLGPTGKVPASSPLRPFEPPEEDDLVEDEDDDEDEDEDEDAEADADGAAGGGDAEEAAATGGTPGAETGTK